MNKKQTTTEDGRVIVTAKAVPLVEQSFSCQERVERSIYELS